MEDLNWTFQAQVAGNTNKRDRSLFSGNGSRFNALLLERTLPGPRV